ncbi:hypothetical protein DEI93_16340 (plasmid) [Curtobacterium sp. MCBD17_035]|uniref:hypothetical protein n=1 Tax=Curtobacterium sp. MCBD17_035 TaxID=2175673 RepID=UPI000DA6DF1A|nr:hypothetical protein [Curtobacterium sp. MCBD17_035]WIB69141.1 hypothetical protein DEI93_16340 [Curtobacterium sp. MCBD17_035]
MAEVRKSAKQTEARRRARANAAAFRARQDQLEQLAADYFVAADSLEDIDDAVEKEIAAVRALAEQQRTVVRRTAETVMQKMLALGITRAEVAERLGITIRDVKKPSTRTGGGRVSLAAAVPIDEEAGGEASFLGQHESEPAFTS